MDGGDHDLLGIESVNSGPGRRARCSCGWTSPVALSAHAAGTLWDEHVGGPEVSDG